MGEPAYIDLTPEGDVVYPQTDPAEWTETLREPHEGYDRVFLARESWGFAQSRLSSRPPT